MNVPRLSAGTGVQPPPAIRSTTDTHSERQNLRRPGVTAAATTAVLAIGDGPGPTAAPTTAAFAIGDGPGPATAPTTAILATGPPITPRPARPGPSGMSGSLCCEGRCI